MTTTETHNPLRAWERLARCAVLIINEARTARRIEPLTDTGRALLKAMAALGIDLDVPQPAMLPAHLRRGLSDRESEVLIGISDGKSNADIGRELYVTEDTVKTHASRLYRKLGATDRANAVAKAFRLGLLR